MKTTSSTIDANLGTQTVRVLAIGLLAVLLLFLMTGCKNKSQSAAGINPVGNYALVSVDGKTLPCSLTHEGATPTIKSGVFIISTNGSCLSRIVFAMPQREDMSREVKATYTLNGSDLTMKWEGAGMTMGHIDGNQFTMTNEGMVFSYRK
ncbi:MAG TPA: hypothetical protein VK327_17845 [Candidatus Paceibacterota bacterium]|nr:hypothetical protein [Candidatus Paceibacterota bacterium]